jgi:maleate cis-trans isomerase
MSTERVELPPAALPLRVCLMVPANNTTMERELLGWLPAGSSCQTLRIPRGPGLLTRDTIPAYRAAALDLARDAARPIDVVAYGCTAAGFISGPESDADLARQVAELCGAPVVTTAGAMVSELLATRASLIGLVTPYSDAVNAGLVAYLEASGITTGRISRLDAPDVQALGRLTESDVVEAAWRLAGSGLDAVFIACSQLPTAGVLETLRDRLGVPVLSSIRATAAQILRASRGSPSPLSATEV